jgi:hypothetical protein
MIVIFVPIFVLSRRMTTYYSSAVYCMPDGHISVSPIPILSVALNIIPLDFESCFFYLSVIWFIYLLLNNFGCYSIHSFVRDFEQGGEGEQTKTTTSHQYSSHQEGTASRRKWADGISQKSINTLDLDDEENPRTDGWEIINETTKKKQAIKM